MMTQVVPDLITLLLTSFFVAHINIAVMHNLSLQLKQSLFLLCILHHFNPSPLQFRSMVAYFVCTMDLHKNCQLCTCDGS